MKTKLIIEALIKFTIGLILVGLLIFVPAGSLKYINGWIFMILLFVPIIIVGIIMFIKNPELLKSRLESKEKQKNQSVIIKLSGLMFTLGFVLAGLDFRYSWSAVPPIIIYISWCTFLMGYILWAIVLKQNTYLSRTIKVTENQKVIDTGLYSVVRHPMYLSTIVLFLSMPLVLGSWVSFFVFLIYPILIIFRIKDEEKLLEKELIGYSQYKEKVKCRIIPFIW